LRKVKNAGTPLHYVFAHPGVIRERPRLIDYYRNLSALSKKGLSQLLSGLDYEKGEKNRTSCFVINTIISDAVMAMKGFRLELARSLIFAEMGTEIQGAWVNVIGKGAARNVEGIILQYLEENGFLSEQLEDHPDKKKFLLKNGWEMVFGSEPDISIRDKKGVLRVAIEIKGSMDKAGAQTRYGEAKKSFSKALAENIRCETIYLASCYTESVLEQIDTDGQVRRKFNLVDILDDPQERKKFLEEIFKYIVRLEK